MRDREGEETVAEPEGSTAGVKDDAADEVVGDLVAQPGEPARIARCNRGGRLDLDRDDPPVAGFGDEVDLGAVAVAQVVEPGLVVEPCGLAVQFVGNERLE